MATRICFPENGRSTIRDLVFIITDDEIPVPPGYRIWLSLPTTSKITSDGCFHRGRKWNYKLKLVDEPSSGVRKFRWVRIPKDEDVLPPR